jgi:hypothetical protein
MELQYQTLTTVQRFRQPFKTSGMWPCVTGWFQTLWRIMVPLSSDVSSPKRKFLHWLPLKKVARPQQSFETPGTTHLTHFHIPVEVNAHYPLLSGCLAEFYTKYIKQRNTEVSMQNVALMYRKLGNLSGTPYVQFRLRLQNNILSLSKPGNPTSQR